MEKITKIESKNEGRLLMTPFKSGIVLVDANNTIQVIKIIFSFINFEILMEIVNVPVFETFGRR